MLRVISNSFLCLVLLQSRFSDAQAQFLRGLGGTGGHPSSSKSPGLRCHSKYSKSTSQLRQLSFVQMINAEMRGFTLSCQNAEANTSNKSIDGVYEDKTGNKGTAR